MRSRRSATVWRKSWRPVEAAPGKTVLTTQFPRLFYRHVVRHARQHRLLAALNIFSVGLGVSVYLAIQIANHSANRSFAASIDLVAGKANLEVQSPGGGFAETLLPKLAAAPGVRAATPLVEGYATLPHYPGEYLQILGVDLFTNQPFATFAIGAQQVASLDFGQWLADPHAVALSDEFARDHGLKIGDPLALQINGREHGLTVRYLIRQADTAAGRGNSRIAAMDIGWAQELMGKVGRLSSIQLLVDQPGDALQVAAQLAKLAPPDVIIAPPGQRSQQVERMLAGFELNLWALSLISLLVGMFLIYNTVAASVVRRRVETGILRALGATRIEVQALFLGEALIFGIIGVLLGILGGTLLARYLLGREIARVISTLYLLVSVDRFYLTPLLVGSAFFFGLGSVVAAAWLPALEGARADPISALGLGLGATADQSAHRSGRWLAAGLGALLLAGGCSGLALTTGPAWLGFASAFFVLLGFAFAAPALTLGGAALVQGSLRGAYRAISGNGRGGAALAALLAVVRLATQNLSRSLHRNAIIIAALMAAIAMTVGISVMIFAFRQTVEIWIDRAIVADIFMTPSANETLGNGALFPPEVLAAIRREPGIRAVDTVREIGVNIRGDRVSLAVVDGEDRNRLTFVGGGAAAKLAAFHEPDHVLVSEPFAHRYHVHSGDALPIPTPGGVVVFRVAGVYYDYSRDAGIIAINRANFIGHWHDDRVMSAAIYLRDPTQLATVAARLRARFNTHGEFLIFSNQAIRERVFEIFAQTFRITSVLRGIAVIVAVIGIFLTLTTLVTERAREIGVLRAIGASRAQLQGVVLVESGLIGALASVLGVAAGLVLSVVLTYVVNKAFFGWTIQFAVPWGSVLLTPLWIVAAALAAGWLPAIRAGRVPIAAAVRSE
jgi:putative ABC transport system permease protein